MSTVNSGSLNDDDSQKAMREKAVQICAEFLGGAWKNISSSDLALKPITGGFSNVLRLCSLPKTQATLADEPRDVLLRLYGDKVLDGRPDSSLTDIVIFMMMSERKLGPRLYGVFPEGRLEEYIPAPHLTCEDLRDPEISGAIARKMAKVHKMKPPISKEPTWLFDTLEKWAKDIQDDEVLKNMARENNAAAQKIAFFDFVEEVRWLKSYVKKVNSPVVFCHNDPQEGNMLLRDGPENIDDRLVFIDLEFSSYNYRGYDIAAEFTEWGCAYTNPEFPYYRLQPQEYPTLQEQLHFVRAYLSALDQPLNSELDTEEHLLKESDAYILATQMMGAIWSAVQAHNKNIAFGYVEFSAVKLDSYFRWKNHLLSADSEKETKK